jgi:hypothetical protein
MNQPENRLAAEGRRMAWVLGALGTLALMAFLVWVLVRSTRPEDLTAARARERAQFLAEVQQAEAEAVNHYAWQNEEKGLVRLPVELAMDLVVQEWQDPAAARARLISRIEEATAPPPEPDNPYE